VAGAFVAAGAQAANKNKTHRTLNRFSNLWFFFMISSEIICETLNCEIDLQGTA
jgi:hypothetical protein